MTAERVLELLAVLRSSGVRATLDGGWGVDALLGRETRAHEDLDLVVALDDVPRIREALRPLGFELHEDQLPVRFVLRSSGEQLDFHTVTFDSEGGGVQPQPGGGSFRYPPEGFVVGRVEGECVPCISAPVQVLCHLGYTPSPKDAHDVRELCRTFGLPVPETYRVQDEVSRLLSRRAGHFALESGHHGETWLDLELLFLHPARVQPFAEVLAGRLAPHAVEAVCGPLVEGAFLALTAASALGVPFVYSERVPSPAARGLFPFRYRIPDVLRPEVAGKRVAVVDDVINAGSAVRGTLDDLEAHGAAPVAVGALAVLGRSAAALATGRGVALEALAAFPNEIWEPAVCPLCVRGVPLTT